MGLKGVRPILYTSKLSHRPPAPQAELGTHISAARCCGLLDSECREY
jgi:hypothetical protein